MSTRLLLEQIVSDPELTGGEQVVLVPVVLERAGLANETVDHMPIVDPVTVLPA